MGFGIRILECLSSVQSLSWLDVYDETLRDLKS